MIAALHGVPVGGVDRPQQRLVTGGKVDDRQPGVDQPHPAAQGHTMAIGATMAHGAGQAVQNRAGGRLAVPGHDAGDAAHGRLFLQLRGRIRRKRSA